MILNLTQERAVKNHGHQLILAGPGSGKTRVIIEEVLHLIDQGVHPDEILALTFSEKAAKEMLERLPERTDRHDLQVHSFCNEWRELDVSGTRSWTGVFRLRFGVDR